MTDVMAPPCASLTFLEPEQPMIKIDTAPTALDLYEFVCRLSAACKANCNVLVDGALVDALETQGRDIQRARGRAKSPNIAKMLASAAARTPTPRRRKLAECGRAVGSVEARYEVLPSNGFYAIAGDADDSPVEDDDDDMPRMVSFSFGNEYCGRKSPERYSPRLDGFRLDMGCDTVKMGAASPADLAASSASTYSTMSMAHYDESDGEEDYEESVLAMSNITFSDRKYSVFSNTSENSASAVLPFDLDPSDPMIVHTLQDQVDSLLLENCKMVAENARLAELSEMTAAEMEALACKQHDAEELLRTQSQRLMSVEQELERSRITAAERIRQEARAEYQAQLAARTQELTVLQSELQAKNNEISRLMQGVDELDAVMQSGSSASRASRPSDADVESLISTLRQNNMVKETEILEMQETLLNKDREICSLYMHLSTKKKLIEEITKSFVKNMEELNETSAASQDVRFDLDTCLFKSVVDKEKRLDELTAALSAMEQEVEDLETRIVAKEHEKHVLYCNQQLLGRTLHAMKSQLAQVQGEKVQLDAALQESQARIASLMESLQEKETQLREFSRLSLSQGASIPGF